MIKFLIGILYLTFSTPLYLGWARQRTDQQISKMQQAAFNTPGAEAPITPDVLLGGLALLWSHFIFGQKVLRMSALPTFFTFIFGLIAGITFFLVKRQQEG
jgi:hypothetical protein